MYSHGWIQRKQFAAPINTGTFHSTRTTRLGEPPPVSLLSYSRGGLVNVAHHLFIQRTERTPCRLPLVLQGILKSSHCYNLIWYPFNLSWEIKNLGCGLLSIPCHKSVSLQRVLPEMGCPTLSKFNTGKIAPFWSCFWKFCGLWYSLVYVIFHGGFSKQF